MFEFWVDYSSDGKESACNAGDLGSIPGSGRSPGEGNGNPLQYSYLGNPMDRRSWLATIHGVTKDPDTTEQLNNTCQTLLGSSRFRMDLDNMVLASMNFFGL